MKMNNAIKSNAINEEQAIAICGKEIVEKVKAQNCEFTGRCIDDCYEVVEMAASVNFGDDQELTILYLIPADQVKDEDLEMDQYDYSNYTFTVN
jgi:hypothetical protein